MTTAEEPWTQLATRIPRSLHRHLRIHCVTRDLVLMHFVVAAIEEKLALSRGTAAKRRGTKV